MNTTANQNEEAVVYAFLVEKQDQTISSIAAATGLSVRSADLACTSLHKRKIVSVRREGEGPSRFMAVSPTIAKSSLAGDILKDAIAQWFELEKISSEFSEFERIYQELSWQSTDPSSSDFISNPAAIGGLIAEQVDRVAVRVYTAHPGDLLSKSGRDRGVNIDQMLETRGVERKTVLDPVILDSESNTRLCEGYLSRGNEIRLNPRIPNRILIFDSYLAIAEITSGHSAVVIRDERTIDILATNFLYLWDVSTHFQGHASNSDFSETELAVLRLLSEGLTDTSAARRLGISLRTYRRHVAEVMDRLGAHSRFEAGVIATKQGAI